jgi:pyridine nucleotide-disulfide oxidoreductase family protein
MKRLLLLGGGHAHVQVLADLAAQGLPGWEVLLVTPHARQIYSGMLPGWIAGHYPLEACAIALDRLAARARVGFLQAAGIGLDLAGQQLLCSDGQRLPYDLISIDTGPMPALAGLPGSAEHALPIRPIEAFVAAWPAWLERLRQAAGSAAAPLRLLVLGAGAAGLEVAFAIRHRARVEGWAGLQISLVDPAEQPLRDAPPRARRRATELLAERGIEWRGRHRATQVTPGQLHLAQGEPLAFDLALLVTGAAAPDWPGRSGLATDAAGFIRVDAALRSVSHPQVFAAGDVAALAEARPKSGVYAVRAGPVLARHLRAACTGQPVGRWQPQRHALYLISTGERHALACWGRWAVDGAWVWRWKDHIDRRFMRRFGTPA